jgi:esterase/lipase superfamily enzyme
MIRLLAPLSVLMLLAACQPPVELMPPPAVFLQHERNLFGANANLDQSNEIQVFYATNRAAIGPRTARTYTIFPGDDLHLGVATMAIGGSGRSWDWLYELSTSQTPEQRPQILLQSLDEKATVAVGAPAAQPGEEARAFFRLIDAALARSADPNLTVYVHGANTSAGRATGQAAQYRHFTGRNSVVLAFVWPSAENFLRFGHDVRSARATAPVVADLVRMLAQHTRARQINLIGYSSGAMVVSPALALLGTPADGSDPRSLRLGEVYFPAPDADFRSFVSDVQAYREYPRRVTVIANLHDSVLVLSQMHQRASRVGRPDPTELSAEDSRWLVENSATSGFDLLSARSENLPGMGRRSHVFWYDHPWVSSDVLFKMLFHLSPQERGLVEDRTEGQLRFWRFPDDYEARMEAAMELAAQRFAGEQASRLAPTG